MTNRLPRLPLVSIGALLAALTLAACGGHKQPTAHGESEGAYIESGPLIYQVQMSRELNPDNVEDREYLEDLPAGTPEPRGDEEWFGVWLRVQNVTDEAHPTAEHFELVDTVGTTYEPIELPPGNPLTYEPVELEGEDVQPVYPDPDGAAGAGQTQGAMLLFKLNTSVYANRPIELEITPPDGGEPSSVVIDL
jgi:hypothetical protein